MKAARTVLLAVLALAAVPAAASAATARVDFETGPALGTPVNDDYLAAAPLGPADVNQRTDLHGAEVLHGGDPAFVHVDRMPSRGPGPDAAAIRGAAAPWTGSSRCCRGCWPQAASPT